MREVRDATPPEKDCSSDIRGACRVAMFHAVVVSAMPTPLPYHLGCPAWSVPEWRGTFVAAGTSQRDFLKHYSEVFNTVEGNSTFYALPKPEIVRRWTQEVGEGFRFCPKVPRDVSHGQGLMARPAVLTAFWEMLVILAEAGKLGLPFLQLPARFGSMQMPELDRFLEAWPAAFPLAVEVRDPVFFQEGHEEKELNELLQHRSVDRVIFDSRALYSQEPSDPVEAVSQTRKPNLPVRWRTTGQRPMLRFVGRNRIGGVDPWLAEAAQAVASWIEGGLNPYVFMHTPDDVLAPQLCARFHEHLRQRLPNLPPLDLKAAAGPQLELFD